MGRCVICGKPGVTLSVAGEGFPICVACARVLHQELTDFISSLSAAGALPGRRGRKPRAAIAVAEPVSAEDLKRKLAERVEARGQISVYEFARRHGLGRPEARQIAEELAKEKGYQVEADSKRLILKKPA